MVMLVNTLTLSKDPTKIIPYPIAIKNDLDLSSRTKDFLLAIFNISLEQNTTCPLVSDKIIAEHMNLRSERGIRRYLKLSLSKNRILKIKIKEKGCYRLAFL